MHSDLNGFRNSSFCVSELGAVASVVVIRPSPASLFPTQEYEAPTPLDGPSNVTFMLGSSFCHGDHSWKRWRSFTTANTASGAAPIDWLRSTWYVGGRVAATERMAMTESVMRRNNESAIFFSMGFPPYGSGTIPRPGRCVHSTLHERV